MKKYITADNWLCFERDVQVPESSKWDVEVEKRFVLTFGTVPSQKRKNNDTRTKLCCAAFSLDAYSEAEAERIWSGYEFRFASRKDSWERKIPLCDDIIELEGGGYVLIIPRGTSVWRTLKEQVEEMEQNGWFEKEASGSGEGSVLDPEDLPQSEKSLLEEWKELLKDPSLFPGGKIRTADDLLSLIHILSAKCLLVRFSEQDLMEFLSAYRMAASGIKDSRDRIEEEFDGRTPLVLDLAEEAAEHFVQTNGILVRNNISPEKLERIQKAEEVLSSYGKQIVCTLVGGRLENCPTQFRVGFDETDFLADMLAVVCMGGSMYCRVIEGDGEKDVIYCFLSRDGELHSVPSDVLRDCAQLEPDGTSVNRDGFETYRDIDFAASVPEQGASGTKEKN